MEVRQLAVKDVFTLARMVGKLHLKPRDDGQSLMLYGQELLAEAVDKCGDDAMAWLADMAGMDAETFADRPAATVVDVIEAIVAQDGARDFFGKLWRLLPKSSSNDMAGQTTPSSDSASGAT